MFRAAFPTASEVSEKREMAWAKEAYDLSGNNGSSREPSIVRLAGTWIDTQTALVFADEYAMLSVIKEIVGAVPDAQASHRRASSRPSVGGGLGMTPAKSSPMQNPMKRRREAPPSSPLVHASPVVAAATTTTSTTTTVAVKNSVSSPLRHTLRARSPLANSKPITGLAATATSTTTASGSDDTAVEDEDAEVAISAGPDMATDVAEQKQLIEELKAQRAAATVTTAAAPAVAEINDDDVAAIESKKREREEEEQQLQFNFKEYDNASSTAEIENITAEERLIATNKRVSRWKPQLDTKQKSAAWGALAFAAGMTAM
jgi:hypothetical protein